jgi:L-cysteine desulfidase
MTAVSWLKEKIKETYDKEGKLPLGYVLNLVSQAKAMEKKIIIDSYCEGFKISSEGWNGEYGIEDFNNLSEEIKAEEYFKNTY